MNNIDKAHTWLKKHCQDFYGEDLRLWTPQQIDGYHRDLGLLVDFVTDTFPEGLDKPHKELHKPKLIGPLLDEQ